MEPNATSLIHPDTAYDFPELEPLPEHTKPTLLSVLSERPNWAQVIEYSFPLEKSNSKSLHLAASTNNPAQTTSLKSRKPSSPIPQYKKNCHEGTKIGD